MKHLILMAFLFTSTFSFAQETEWIKTEGEITDITIHSGRKTRESALVKFKLENGAEQMGSVELFRIPFIGSMKSVGDKLTINYNKNNPVVLETVIGKLISSYGMYFLIILGIIFSIKPFLKLRNNKSNN